MPSRVIDARPIFNFAVWLQFNDGSFGLVDLATELDGPVFGPLRDPEMFRSFRIVGHALAWPNGADFAPEFLHFSWSLKTPAPRETVFLFSVSP